MSDAGNLFTIGNRPQGTNSSCSVLLDDYRIYDRVLSDAEVKALHDLGQ